MNLNAIAGPLVAAVNPKVTVTYKQSNGYTATTSDGRRTPNFLADVPMLAQRQPLTVDDLKQLDGLNIGGEKVALYVDGEVKAVVRGEQRGGDLFVMPDGSTWLLVHVLEGWSPTAGWTKCAVVRQ